MHMVSADQPVALTSASWEEQGAQASHRTDVLRLRSFLSLGRLEFDLLVLVQRPVAGARDRGEVDEPARRPVIGGDETKALVDVEPLHCAGCPQFNSLTPHSPTRPRPPPPSPPPPPSATH